VRRPQGVDNVIGDLIGHFDKREPIVNLDGTDDIGVELQLVRDRADDVTGTDLGLAPRADVDLRYFPTGFALGAGYSSRWLHKKFTERLGTGPKNLTEIVRFKQFYEVYSAGATLHRLKEYMYEYYYDQSHFLKAFKRLTGFTPTDLQNGGNELATLHYTS